MDKHHVSLCRKAVNKHKEKIHQFEIDIFELAPNIQNTVGEKIETIPRDNNFISPKE